MKMYTIVFILTLLSIANGQQVNDQYACPGMPIQCICGEGENRQKLILDVEAFMVPDPQTGKMKCSLIADPYQACTNHYCTFVGIGDMGLYGSNYRTPANNSKPLTFPLQPRDYGIPPYNSVPFFPLQPDDSRIPPYNSGPLNFPQVFNVPSGGYPNGHRYARATGPCHVTPLKFASVKCWKWPNWMNCDIVCNYGHAFMRPHDLSPVEKTNINCRSSENVWKPHGFIDCKPFLNCGVHLVAPGELRCKQPLHYPAYCEISCTDYEGKKGSPMQRYECKDENFQRSLPHCAVLKDNNVDLIRKPARGQQSRN